MRLLLLTAVLLWMPRAAAAQIPAGCSSSYERLATITEQVRPGHFRLREKAEVTCDNHKFFADHVDFYTDEDRLVASGNVLLVTPDTRITATRVEFDLKAKTGVFYDASGVSKVKPAVGTKTMYGTQEADMYFRGEKLEKLGEKKYRLTRGGFTTCLQPTARWEFTSGTVTINVNRYALAKNTVFRVKGVPLLYLPIIYYPLDDDDRSTGVLLPTYGNSYLHGQTIRNAFFWAINRSMDVTFMHDWFSRSGQAFGSEFRYVAGPGSSGKVKVSLMDQKETETTLADGTFVGLPAARNFQVDGDLTQQLPGRFRLGARANYFSDLSIQQLHSYNVYQYTAQDSSIQANLSGQIAGLQLGASFSHREYFHSSGASTITGSTPQIVVSRPEQTIGRLPVYWGFNTEFIRILSRTGDGKNEFEKDRVRFDFLPTVRAPLTRLTWLTLAATASWRSTWWSRGADSSRRPVDEPISRQYWEFQLNGTGPTFTRTFNTPASRYAQRWKHIIEPSFGFSRRSEILVKDRILTDYDSTDIIAGNITRFNYALSSRLYAKRGEGPSSNVRELFDVSVSQNYYTDAQSASDDQLSRNPLLRHVPRSNFSPVDISLRVSPAGSLSVQARAEYEQPTNTFRQFSANTTISLGNVLDITSAWSKQRQPKESPYAADPYYNGHAISGAATLKTRSGKYGGTYGTSYDISNGGFVNQRILAYYNPQCCGIAIDYQRSDRPNYGGGFILLERRFNISFTLAGLGSFEDIFGAFGADINRR